MDITPRISQSQKSITGYGQGGFKINHERVDGSVILYADRLVPWHVQDISTLMLEQIAFVLESGEVELLLIGTGRSVAQPPFEIRQTLKAKNIALEVMDTGAACRTYNVLLAEGRRVAAALIAV